DWFMVFGSYGESFRAPSFNEIYADEIHFPIFITDPPFVLYNSFITNPDLRPETTATWELGAGLDFADVLQGGDSFRLKGSY
ncbi:TonB-dependent receptor, partial [Enterococcus hirae]